MLEPPKVASIVQKVASVVQIESVRLSKGSFRSIKPSNATDAATVQLSRDAVVVAEPRDGQPFLVEVRFRLETLETSKENASMGNKQQVEIQGTFELAYRLPGDEEFSTEDLTAFAQVNAVFNAWPYWREYVQSSLARMSMPVLTMPLFRVENRS